MKNSNSNTIHNLAKILNKEQDLLILKNELISISELHDVINKTVPHVAGLRQFQRFKENNKDFLDFDQSFNFKANKPLFVNALNPIYQNLNVLLDYRAFKSFLQFTDSNIEYNVQHMCFTKKNLSSFDINESESKLCIRLIAYRDACERGDKDLIAVYDSQTYSDIDITDNFHSFEFEVKKKMFELAQSEGRLVTSTLSSVTSILASSRRVLPDNVFVSKMDVPDLTNKNKASYNNTHELTIASIAAADHCNYLYYITCDRSKKDIELWLTSSGYTQVCFHSQSRPDLVIIDFVRKLFIFYDIKNCKLDNINKYLGVQEQLLVFMGHLSQSDRIYFMLQYKKKQILSLSSFINNTKVNSSAKQEAQKMYNDIIKGNFSDEELFNLDPFITNMASVVSTQNNTSVLPISEFIQE